MSAHPNERQYATIFMTGMIMRNCWEKKVAHFWIVQQSCGDEYFEALKVSERIL